jgi:hypothetical protein
VKERDCPGQKQECRGENYENVYLEGETPKPGRYRVRVRLEHPAEDEAKVRVTFGARVGGKTYASTMVLSAPEETKELNFSL